MLTTSNSADSEDARPETLRLPATSRLTALTQHSFRSWPQLAEEIAHAVRPRDAVLDGEVCCLDADGCSDFKSLLFRREWPLFYAFDLLHHDGRDLQREPIEERREMWAG